MGADDVIRLVQITDFHLTADGPESDWPVDTDATLAAVIDRVRADVPAPHLVLATGDLSQDGSAESYRRVKALFGHLDAPVYCLPGNHDDPAVLADAMPGDGVHVERRFSHGNWQIVFLDSTIAGRDDGRVDDGDLAALETALGDHGDRHALVCLHHHPMAVGGAWRDEIGIENPDALFGLLDRHPQVRGLLWGHIHQPFDGMRGHLRLMGTPSTCFQFIPGADGGLAIGDDPPGYRRIALHGDGAIDTEIRWLDGAAPGDS